MPDLSLVMPCFNEEDVLPYTIPNLLDQFEAKGMSLEIVAVDNGSSDRTGEILSGMVDDGRAIRIHRVEENVGYGNGILQGLPLCTAEFIGIIPADGQVDAEDVVRLFEALRSAEQLMIGKVRRRFRMDGFWRKMVSMTYNGLVYVLWPGIGSIDVNGSPKIFPKALLEELSLEATCWFLDPEIMIKARHLRVPVLEMNVFARMRGNGLSHVRAGTCWEFLKNLLLYRSGLALLTWKREVKSRRSS